MANEIKNRQHAIGTFVPVVAPPFTSTILNSVGISQFTRNSPGNYTVELTDAIGFAGAQVGAKLPANFLGLPGASLAADGGSVLVTVFDLAGAPVDPPFVGLEVTSVVEGEGIGPAAALPAPPAPPGGSGKLIAWATVDNLGALIAQSIEGLVNPPAIGGVGLYNYTLTGGGPIGAMAATQARVGPQADGIEVLVTGALTGDVQTYEAGIGPNGHGHTVYFYTA